MDPWGAGWNQDGCGNQSSYAWPSNAWGPVCDSFASMCTPSLVPDTSQAASNEPPLPPPPPPPKKHAPPTFTPSAAYGAAQSYNMYNTVPTTYGADPSYGAGPVPAYADPRYAQMEMNKQRRKLNRAMEARMQKQQNQPPSLSDTIQFPPLSQNKTQSQPKVDQKPKSDSKSSLDSSSCPASSSNLQAQIPQQVHPSLATYAFKVYHQSLEHPDGEKWKESLQRLVDNERNNRTLDVRDWTSVPFPPPKSLPPIVTSVSSNHHVAPFSLSKPNLGKPAKQQPKHAQSNGQRNMNLQAQPDAKQTSLGWQAERNVTFNSPQGQQSHNSIRAWTTNIEQQHKDQISLSQQLEQIGGSPKRQSRPWKAKLTNQFSPNQLTNSQSNPKQSPSTPTAFGQDYIPFHDSEDDMLQAAIQNSTNKKLTNAQKKRKKMELKKLAKQKLAKKGKKKESTIITAISSDAALAKRSQRFQDHSSPEVSFSNTKTQVRKAKAQVKFRKKLGVRSHDEPKWDLLKIRGTCQNLEKPYLRLTSAPAANTVRPEQVLQRAYHMLVGKWKGGSPSDASDSNYLYICEQFKSMRQDLMVQGIKNHFTTDVYETHARIALDVGDFSEYNQCQTQLKHLYHDEVSLRANMPEFLSYRVLYHLITSNFSAINKIMLETPQHIRSAPMVIYAFRMRDAYINNNFCAFCHLSGPAPFPHGRSLIRPLLKRIRLAGLRCIIQAFRPTIPVSFIMETLVFESKDQCVDYLISAGAEFGPSQEVIDCKSSVIHAPLEHTNAEEEDIKKGVSHGVFA